AQVAAVGDLERQEGAQAGGRDALAGGAKAYPRPLRRGACLDRRGFIRSPVMAELEDRALLRVKVEGYLNLVRIHREIEARALELLDRAGIHRMTMAQATALLVLVQEGAPIT